jgi:hypothetical protein
MPQGSSAFEGHPDPRRCDTAVIKVLHHLVDYAHATRTLSPHRNHTPDRTVSAAQAFEGTRRGPGAWVKRRLTTTRVPFSARKN